MRLCPKARSPPLSARLGPARCPGARQARDHPATITCCATRRSTTSQPASLLAHVATDEHVLLDIHRAHLATLSKLANLWSWHKHPDTQHSSTKKAAGLGRLVGCLQPFCSLRRLLHALLRRQMNPLHPTRPPTGRCSIHPSSELHGCMGGYPLFFRFIDSRSRTDRMEPRYSGALPAGRGSTPSTGSHTHPSLPRSHVRDTRRPLDPVSNCQSN